MRYLAWFSCGAPSAVAAKLAVQQHGAACIVLYCDTGGEHPDNVRFLADVARWIKADVVVLKNPRYADHFDVVEKNRYVNGAAGAKCTQQLKRVLRERYQRPDDVHVWGFTAEEKQRADEFEENNPGLLCSWPLIEADLRHEDCLGMIQRAGIEVPAMYKMGYRNNNCIGCVKGGMGYWNKVRIDFPAAFARMAVLERTIGHSCIRRGGKPLFLDELAPGEGRYDAEPQIECGLVCEIETVKLRERDHA